MSPILHTLMQQQAHKRRAAKAKSEYRRPRPCDAEHEYMSDVFWRCDKIKAEQKAAQAKEQQMTDSVDQPKTDDQIFQDQMAFVLMAKAADRQGEAEPAKAASPFAADTFESKPKAKPAPEPELPEPGSEQPHRRPCKPHKEPGPGLALRLARWLNLK